MLELDKMGNNGGGHYHRWTPTEIRLVLKLKDHDKMSMAEIKTYLKANCGFEVSPDSVQGVYKKYSKDSRYMGAVYSDDDAPTAESDSNQAGPSNAAPPAAENNSQDGSIQSGSTLQSDHNNQSDEMGPEDYQVDEDFAGPSSSYNNLDPSLFSGDENDNIQDTELYQSIMADESLAPEEGGPSFVGCDRNGDGVWQWPNGEQFVMPIGNMQ